MAYRDDDVVLVSAKRTPVGSFCGALADVSAPQLGAAAVRAVLADFAPERVDEVVMGNVLTAGVGQNPARQAALAAGLAAEVPATTVNVVCGSGLKAVQMAAQALRCGDAEVVVAGGQESMSQSPHFVRLRGGVKMGDAALTDSMVADGLTDAYHHYHMGITAENIARQLGISRTEQDEFALLSQQKAAAAQQAGHFDVEITPVDVPQRKGGSVRVARDEYLKPDTDLAKLARLRPAFCADGTVTAGNASGLNDGAAAVLMMRAQTARQYGLTPLARLAAYSATGIDPAVMGLAPVDAVRQVLAKAGWRSEEVDWFELNEAFAAQALGVLRQLSLPAAKVNPNGGAIAIGHPIGASGCRILVSLLHQMCRTQTRRGVAALCVGGGMGFAVAVERV
nr:acetyl-CoA C-acetyltransferase [Conchiformibius kuhniae]